MLKALFTFLRIFGDIKAAGKGTYGKRIVKRQAHKTLARAMRKGGF